MKGLEPSRREAHAPKACVSTNSTTSPWYWCYFTERAAFLPAHLVSTFTLYSVVIITNGKILVLWYYLTIMEGTPQDPESNGDPMLDAIYKAVHTMSADATPAQYEWMGRRLLGLDDLGIETSSIPKEVRDALGSLIREHSQATASSDPTNVAEAKRFFGTLAEAVGRVTLGEQAKDPDERFMQQPLSGEEARICCIEVLDRTDGLIAEVTREQHNVPPGSAAQDRNRHERVPAFTPEEQNVAAMVLSVSLKIVELAVKEGKLVTADTLLGNERQRGEIEGIVLADDRIGIGTPEQRRAAVQSVFEKLPGLLRQAFERQQAALRQMRQETRDL
jgi:hypothetical protein